MTMGLVGKERGLIRIDKRTKGHAWWPVYSYLTISASSAHHNTTLRKQSRRYNASKGKRKS
jgi:hypothetical protein